jgi:hypothetical protein
VVISGELMFQNSSQISRNESIQREREARTTDRSTPENERTPIEKIVTPQISYRDVKASINHSSQTIVRPSDFFYSFFSPLPSLRCCEKGSSCVIDGSVVFG